MEKKHMMHVLWMVVMALVILAAVSGSRALAAEFEIVSYTAYTSLYWLKDAGVPEAKEFASVVGRNVVIDSRHIEADKRLAPVNRLYPKNNVLLQAAQSMLSQANQNSSNVLSLLQ